MRMHLSGPSLAYALAGALIVGVPAIGGAQVVNPTIAEFTPSPDHSRLASDGTAWVTRYDLGFYQQGASSPFQVASLGKPAPASDGQIRINLSTLTLPSAGIVYEARVIAVGPGGSTPSAASNTFMFAAPCTYTVAPTSHTITAAAWSGTVDVSAGTNCQWTAVSNDAGWLGIGGAGASTSGTGNARLSIYAVANPSTTERTGTYTIAGQTVTIRQAGAACTFSLSPTSLSAQATGGTFSVRVAAPVGCSWQASASGWLAVAPTSGIGDGTVTVTVAANTTTSQRSASVTIANRSVPVTQSGQAPCAFSVNQTQQSFAAAGGQGSIAVTTGSTCTWSAMSQAAWLTITSGSQGSGNGSLAFTVAANPVTTSRTGTLLVAGVTVTVTQAGAACRYVVTPTSHGIAAGGGTALGSVTTTNDCAWTTANTGAASWLTVSIGQSGSGDYTLAATRNTSTSSRAAVVTIAGTPVSVTQSAGAACQVSVSPSSVSVEGSGTNNASVQVTAGSGCAWTASSSASWLVIRGGNSGSGDGRVTFRVDANTTASSRAATLTIGGQEVTVSQAAAGVPKGPKGIRIVSTR